jgi:Tfp pilus assembly protein PilX
MRITRGKSTNGSVLVTAIVMTAVMAVILASYLTLLASRNRITMRSQAWNESLPLLEAGIEEAFTHLNDDAVLTNNGWNALTVNSNLVYQKRRDFTNSGAYFLTSLSNVTASTVDVYARGFVPAPLGTGYISRLVHLTTTNPVTFSKAVAAVGTITMSGGAMVDSFNSTDPASSTNGQYLLSLHKANGGLATDSTAHPAIDIKSAHVYGTVNTGSGGTVIYSGAGAAGDATWLSGIQPSASNSTFNVSFPDQSVPGPWVPATPVGGTNSGTNYQYVLNGSISSTPTQFELSALTLSGGSGKMLITGKAILYVPGNVNVSGSAYIYLAPGASFDLYTAGSTTVLSGGGVINGTGLAKNFSYHGLPSNTSITYSGSASFIGTINAPEAAFTISGSAAMVGAAIVNTFNDSGGAAIHYDEGLGGRGQLTMTSYVEL